MSMDLNKYFDERYQEMVQKNRLEKQAFVTISRQTGCNSFEISTALVDLINKRSKTKWKVVNKELIELSVSELSAKKNTIEAVFNAEKHGHLDEIIRAFGSRYYKSDSKIRNTIKTLIRSMVTEGGLVLVGRAGAAVTKDLPGGLHIRIEAPLAWRVQNLARKKNMTEMESLTNITVSDKNRSKLFQDFCKKTIDEFDFDLRFNNSTLTDSEIAQMIFDLLINRGLV